MKVAIDSGPVSKGNPYGGGTYVKELIQALKANTKQSEIQIEPFDLFAANLSSKRFEVFHFTRFRPYFVSLPFAKPAGTKFILTIFDLIPLIYPKHYPPGIRGWIKWQINKFLIRKDVDAVITISETSKKDICRFLGVDPGKVFVTHLAAPDIYKPITNKSSLEDIKKKYSLPERFALCDTDLYYSKNIPNLVRACKIAKIPLIIVNKNAKEVREKRPTGLNHPELVHLKTIDWRGVETLGLVPIEDLVKIYNLATVYIQPSLYEGFGIPVNQAITCNVPVVVTKNQCHVEILGDDFTYVDPNVPEDIAKGILHPNINKKLPRIYSWEKTADETLKIYNKVA